MNENQIERGLATSTKTGGVATFTVNGKTVTCQVARDLTIAIGDVCLLNKLDNEWVAVQRLYTAAPAAVVNPALPDPKPASITGNLVIPPIETRSWRVGDSTWRTADDDVIQGNLGMGGNHIGCAFYGDLPKSLTGATIAAVTAQIRRPARGGSPGSNTTTLRLVAESELPEGLAPTLTSTTAGPTLAWDEESVFTIPTAWVTAMVAGAAGGVAAYVAGGTPLVVLSGRGDWSPAFTLSVSWSR